MAARGVAAGAVDILLVQNFVREPKAVRRLGKVFVADDGGGAGRENGAGHHLVADGRVGQRGRGGAGGDGGGDRVVALTSGVGDVVQGDTVHGNAVEGGLGAVGPQGFGQDAAAGGGQGDGRGAPVKRLLQDEAAGFGKIDQHRGKGSAAGRSFGRGGATLTFRSSSFPVQQPRLQPFNLSARHDPTTDRSCFLLFLRPDGGLRPLRPCPRHRPGTRARAHHNR